MIRIFVTKLWSHMSVGMVANSFVAAPPPVSMSGSCNDGDRFSKADSILPSSYMKMKTSGVGTPPCTGIYVPLRSIVDVGTSPE